MERYEVIDGGVITIQGVEKELVFRARLGVV